MSRIGDIVLGACAPAQDLSNGAEQDGPQI
jgi:phosphotransacetylase